MAVVTRGCWGSTCRKRAHPHRPIHRTQPPLHLRHLHRQPAHSGHPEESRVPRGPPMRHDRWPHEHTHRPSRCPVRHRIGTHTCTASRMRRTHLRIAFDVLPTVPLSSRETRLHDACALQNMKINILAPPSTRHFLAPHRPTG